MSKQEIEKRIGELEDSLKGDETDDDTRGEVLDEIAKLEEQLDEVQTM
ncbi:hypothetical protein [Pseudomonas juntendi]|nr:hypothetical protein [Pseudomonas juntendi]